MNCTCGYGWHCICNPSHVGTNEPCPQCIPCPAQASSNVANLESDLADYDLFDHDDPRIFYERSMADALADQ